MNRNNTGTLRGRLAYDPAFQERRNGAYAATFVIITDTDPGEGDWDSKRSADQSVTVKSWVSARNWDNSPYRELHQGDYVECEFHVESYTYEYNGEQRSGQSLNVNTLKKASPDAGGQDGGYDDAPVYDDVPYGYDDEPVF